MGETLRAPKGFNDAVTGAKEAFLDARLWQHIFDTTSRVSAAYGYAPAFLPIVEETPLFVRGLGTETDVVSKEMYTFSDRGDRSLTLRPEGTAGAVRAYVEHHFARNEPVQKWFYHGAMFRAERPQKGRYRQFYQIGAEAFGAAGPLVDVELLQMLRALSDALGLPPLELCINTLGDAASRTVYLQRLTAFVEQQASSLCDSCRARGGRNPLRVLDCKEASCRAVLAHAPDILASLSDASRLWFDRYQSLLAQAGLAFRRRPSLVRGLDYSSEAIFELRTDALGAQDAVFGGGRYDGLVGSLGGPPTPAVGMAAGVERIALLLAASGAAFQPTVADCYLAAADAEGEAKALSLAQLLRQGPTTAVTLDPEVGRLKHAVKRAARANARYFVAIGARECSEGTAQLKRLADGSTQTISLDVVALRAALAPSQT